MSILECRVDFITYNFIKALGCWRECFEIRVIQRPRRSVVENFPVWFMQNKIDCICLATIRKTLASENDAGPPVAGGQFLAVGGRRRGAGTFQRPVTQAVMDLTEHGGLPVERGKKPQRNPSFSRAVLSKFQPLFLLAPHRKAIRINESVRKWGKVLANPV